MRRFYVCRSEELEEGKGRWTKLVPGTDAYVFRLKGTVRAFLNRCTHMGGTVELNPQKTQLCCRQHFATFDPLTGARTGGEAPEGSALTTVDVDEKDGEICLNWSLPQDPFSL